ncbi:MAG: hypothetical protein JSV80_13370 [Acidobacteriota bacterium]|nr:MAG: hypothetical protein JSV80_13370 [Acidobacteriota bacterium]
MVEVEREEVERIGGDAHVETISPDEKAAVRRRPTPPSMRRKIMLRESGHCANPRCSHLADHCHHIVFLSEGGETVLTN